MNLFGKWKVSDVALPLCVSWLCFWKYVWKQFLAGRQKEVGGRVDTPVGGGSWGWAEGGRPAQSLGHATHVRSSTAFWLPSNRNKILLALTKCSRRCHSSFFGAIFGWEIAIVKSWRHFVRRDVIYEWKLADLSMYLFVFHSHLFYLYSRKDFTIADRYWRQCVLLLHDTF